MVCVFFFQAEDGIRDIGVTGVQTCALPIYHLARARGGGGEGLLDQECLARVDRGEGDRVVLRVRRGHVQDVDVRVGQEVGRTGERRGGKGGRSRGAPYI